MNTIPYEITLYRSQADFVLADSSTTYFTSTHFEIVQTRQSFRSTIIIVFLAVATDQFENTTIEFPVALSCMWRQTYQTFHTTIPTYICI